jgi:hypothetical protein
MSFLSRIIPRRCAYFSRPILSCAEVRQASTRSFASNIRSSIPAGMRTSFQGSKPGIFGSLISYTPSSSKAPKRIELKALAVELPLMGVVLIQYYPH